MPKSKLFSSFLVLACVLSGCVAETTAPQESLGLSLCTKESYPILQKIFQKPVTGMGPIDQNDYHGCAYNFEKIDLNITFFEASVLDGQLVSPLQLQYDGVLKMLGNPEKNTFLQKDLGLGEKSFYYDSGTIGNLYVLQHKAFFEASVVADDWSIPEREKALLEVYNIFGSENVVRATITPETPSYTFHLLAPIDSTPGFIAVFNDQEHKEALQIIPIDSTMWLADRLVDFFEVQDVNFDGFKDIGVPVEGGSKWAKYRFWLFDKATGTFALTPFSSEFEKIPYNEIAFDKKKQQITVKNFEGEKYPVETVYQVKNGHISLLKK